MNMLTYWKESKHRLALSVSVLIAVIMAFLVPMSAAAVQPPQPVFGEYFFGTTAAAGQAFPAGTVVSVKVDGASVSYVKSAKVDAQGRYGYTPSELLVPGDSTGQNGAKPGALLSFYLTTPNGRTVQARLFNVATSQESMTVPFVPMSTTQLNLVTSKIQFLIFLPVVDKQSH